MTVISVEQVIVESNETEIIPPTETDKTVNRVFAVANTGDEEIEVKAFGMNEGEEWQERCTKVIPAHDADSLIVGPSVWIVTLKGRTLGPGANSMVDASLVW